MIQKLVTENQNFDLSLVSTYIPAIQTILLIIVTIVIFDSLVALGHANCGIFFIVLAYYLLCKHWTKNILVNINNIFFECFFSSVICTFLQHSSQNELYEVFLLFWFLSGFAIKFYICRIYDIDVRMFVAETIFFGFFMLYIGTYISFVTENQPVVLSSSIVRVLVYSISIIFDTYFFAFFHSKKLNVFDLQKVNFICNGSILFATEAYLIFIISIMIVLLRVFLFFCFPYSLQKKNDNNIEFEMQKKIPQRKTPVLTKSAIFKENPPPNSDSFIPLERIHIDKEKMLDTEDTQSKINNELVQLESSVSDFEKCLQQNKVSF